MARGLTRWPALAGACLLGAFVALYRGGPSADARYARPRLGRKFFASDSLVRTRRAIDSLEMRSGQGEQQYRLGLRRPGISLVWVDDSGRAFHVPAGDSTGLDSAWERLPGHHPEARVLVRLGHSWSAGRAELPDAGAPALCVTDQWNVDGRGAGTWDDAIGACGYYAAFGRPGPLVGTWLVRSHDWIYAAPLGAPVIADTGSWDVKMRRLWASDGWDLRLTRAALPPSIQASVHAASCAAAVPGSCVAVALDTASARPWYRSSEGLLGLGGLQYRLLTDAERQFGPDRFRAFWQSSADVPTAFEQAFGVSMDAWVHGEVVSYFGPLKLGAGNLDRAAISALLWALVFLGLTALIARRLRY